MIIQKSIYKNWLDKKETKKSDFYKRNKNFRYLVDKNKVGKFRYHITDDSGYNHISMVRLTGYDFDTHKDKLVYEILGYHAQDTKQFDTYNQAIKFINDYYNGKIKINHYCECGLNWESN